MALWISLAFLLFFCICCIPLMIIWHRRHKYFYKEDGSPVLCFSKRDSGDDHNQKPSSSKKDSKSKKNKDEAKSAKRDQQEKEKREKQEKADKEKAKQEKNKVKNPADKKNGKEEPKKKSYDQLYSSGSDIISSSPTENPTRSTYIAPPARTRNATEPNSKPPDQKKFSISKKGRVTCNDPVAQRLALARGVRFLILFVLNLL